MEKSIKISLVGDIFPSNTQYTKGFGNGSLFTRNLGKEWESRLSELFSDSIIAFGNLEVPLIEDNKFAHESSFAGSELFAKTLSNAGFDIVSIANNHILEQGKKGFFHTKKALSKAGVYYVGAFNHHKSNIVVLEKNNFKFGFAAFNGINDIPNPNLHADLNFENIQKTLDELSSLNVDYKLLSFHWGNEYSNIPSYDQIELAHSTIEYGADVIIGHHPHVVQPVERYKNGIIIYSLGNFIFDFLYSKEFKLGMLVELNINNDAIIDYKIIGVQLDEEKINFIDDSWVLQKKIKKYETIMHDLLTRSKDKYKQYYYQKLKMNRLYQRILMKIKLVKLLTLSKHRGQVLNNILSKILPSKN